MLPDLWEISDEQRRQIVKVMPKLVPQPRGEAPAAAPPPGGPRMRVGRQRAIISDVDVVPGGRALDPQVSTITEGTSIGGGPAIPSVKSANAKLSRRQKRVDFENQPILDYREAFIDALPTTNGIRLAEVMRDAGERLATGEPSFQDAVDRMLDESADPSMKLSKANRRELIRAAKAIGKIETYVDTKTYRDGSRIKTDQRLIKMKRAERDQLLTNLRGGSDSQ